MNTLIEQSESNAIVQPSDNSPRRAGTGSAGRHPPICFRLLVALLAGALFLLGGAPAARADRAPANCAGSGLGITLYTDVKDAHIGDVLYYGITVFNGIVGGTNIVCDATEIKAFIITPDGVTVAIPLTRTTLHNGQADFYPVAVGYVVRAQDIQPDGTVRARAYDNGVIHQNDTNSEGGGEQGVNTEINQPCIKITAQCVGSVGETGAITISGTVTNCGNTTLVGVTVTNFVNNGAFTVLFPTNLAIGQSVSFSGSYVPLNPCAPSTATLITRAVDEFTTYPKTVTSSATTTCQNGLTPGIAMTQACPLTPGMPGGPVRYTGTVKNTGNITLTNVVIVNDLSGATPIFTTNLLTPGTVAAFSGSYIGPTNCSSTSTSTATGQSLCGDTVSRAASTTCLIQTAPAIQVTVACPTAPVPQGGILTFSGTVGNPGNITLTNVVVVNNWPAPGVVVFTAPSLAPGEVKAFTGSFVVPANCCVAWNTVVATGQDCSGTTVSDSDSGTCPVFTQPRLVVTKFCAPGLLRPGDLLAYSGTVSNAGNIVLLNVSVVSGQSGGNLLPGLVALAPGESLLYTASYIVPPDFCGTDTVTASGLNGCSYATVANSVTVTCPVLTAPRLVITQDCPALPAPHGSTVLFSATVGNAGNVTLTNVYVVANQPAIYILGPITLTPGQIVKFGGSYLAPSLCCQMVNTLTAAGRDRCTGSNVTATATAVCPLLYTPALTVTPNCPAKLPAAGDVVALSGLVRNTGDAILTNVLVFTGQGGTNLLLLGPIDLSPGESEPYSGVTVASNRCDLTVTATGQETCAGTVTASAGLCPMATTSAIELTQTCPPNQVIPGGLLTYSGTVRNAGSITLTNVTVVNNQSGATPILTMNTLAPGASAYFTGSYLAPTNCSTTSISTAIGRSLCGVAVSNSVSTICPILTIPSIAITETCPPGPVTAGTSVVFGGLVSNTGNITLTNVLVFSMQPAPNTLVLGPIPLAPGASAPFTGSYIASGGSNPTTNSAVVTNSTGTVTTNIVDVVTPNTTVIVTTNGPTATSFGTIASPAQTVVDRFVMSTNFNGLTYAGEDHGYGATELYVMRKATTGTSFFDTIIPSTATTTDRFAASNRTYDALTYAAGDLGYGPLLFYYLSHDPAGVSSFGSITPGGAVGVTADHFVVGQNFDALAYTATDVGYGANLFYYVRHDASGLSTFGTINPALPGTITDRFTVGNNVDALVFTDLTAPGYGPNNFYYLRHNASGVSTFGTIFVTGLTTATVTDRFTVGTNATELTFTATDVGFGANLFYFLRDRFTIQTNIITTFTTNTVITFTTNTVTTFVTNSVISFTPTNTVMATGTDTCQARTVAAAANCRGAIVPVAQPASTAQHVVPVIVAPTMAAFVSGSSPLLFTTTTGKRYIVQYKDTLNEPAWIDLETVVGTGGNLPITDAAAARQPMRFYRVVSTPY